MAPAPMKDFKMNPRKNSEMAYMVNGLIHQLMNKVKISSKELEIP
jgi:hypothetical protein